MSEPTLTVTFMNGPADGRQATLKGPSVTIGHGRHNDLVIDFDARVAETHLEIVHQDGRWHLIDRSCEASILLNRQPLHRGDTLTAGAYIALGDTLLRFEFDQQET